jgi:hypothetical protein
MHIHFLYLVSDIYFVFNRKTYISSFGYIFLKIENIYTQFGVYKIAKKTIKIYPFLFSTPFGVKKSISKTGYIIF